VAPENLRFTKNAYGRPEIANSNHCKEKIRFNISYSKDIIVLAVAMNVDIGIDIEFVDEDTDFFLYSKSILSEKELWYLTNMPSEARSREFFKIWTLKEAYIKARGLGLAIGVDKLSFRLNAEKIDLCIDEDIDKSADSWDFFNAELIPSYMISICIKKSANRSSNIMFNSMTSLEDMMNFAGPTVRSSG
jgi:4'-phosphopantetheinyl transferase